MDSLGKSEDLKQEYQYFAELERMGISTDLSILGEVVVVIGRHDLVEDLDEKNDYFIRKDHQKGLF